MEKELINVKRALISVYDKVGLDDFAKKLITMNIEIISTGGTSDFLKSHGIPVTEVSEITNFPELMDGRLKTLHPKIHGGLLGVREDESHLSAMRENQIPEIDLLVVNLYPFESIINKNVHFAEIIENIDIGGPAMIRAGAKNHKYVAVLVDQDDYKSFFEELNQNSGCTSGKFRRNLAKIAFGRSAEYDGKISEWMNLQSIETAPRRLNISGRRSKVLRYGENPHQFGSYYQTNPQRDILSLSKIHQGKDLSFNNLNDFNGALEVLQEFDNDKGALAVIIKHGNACGVALRDNPLEAYLAAFDCDRTSAFGGVIAFNVNIDKKTAMEVCNIFTEIVIAPSVDPDAIVEFKKKKDMRLITINKNLIQQKRETIYKTISGGLLVQDKDVQTLSRDSISIVSNKKPSKKELDDMFFAWKVVKHIKSNAIVFATNTATVGIGAGQMSRVDSTKIAKRKAEDMCCILGKEKSLLSLRAVAASDAFFPFGDSILELSQAGIKGIIQPGGSIRDDDVIKEANKHGISMVFTNIRHFKH